LNFRLADVKGFYNDWSPKEVDMGYNEMWINMEINKSAN